MSNQQNYICPLHAGSLVAAMASYLDAKANHGRWLLRIEDVDEARTAAGAAESILVDLMTLGMHWDGEVAIQSQRARPYEAAFERLGRLAYPCGCQRCRSVSRYLSQRPTGRQAVLGTSPAHTGSRTYR